MIMIFVVNHLVLLGKEKVKINALPIFQFKLSDRFFLPLVVVIIVVLNSKSEKRVRINNCRLFSASCMYDFKMSLNFILCLESHIALRFTVVVGTQEV